MLQDICLWYVSVFSCSFFLILLSAGIATTITTASAPCQPPLCLVGWPTATCLKYLRTLAVLISARYIWGTDVPVLYPSDLVMSSNKHCCYYMPDCLYGVFAQSVTWIGCDSCVLASVDLEPSWGLFMYCHGLATGRVSSVCHSYITWQGLILHNTSSSLPPSLSAISCLKHSCSSSS